MVNPGGKATCVKADTLGLPSDHMLNYGIFDVVMELDKNQIFRPILAYIYVHQHRYSTTPEPIII